MMGSILTVAETNPTLVIGGIVNKFQTNAISGDGDIIVVEADEFDRSFLTLQPTMGLITNLDLEHLDCYEILEDLQRPLQVYLFLEGTRKSVPCPFQPYLGILGSC